MGKADTGENNDIGGTKWWKIPHHAGD